MLTEVWKFPNLASFICGICFAGVNLYTVGDVFYVSMTKYIINLYLNMWNDIIIQEGSYWW